MRPVAWFGLAASAALFAACSDSAPRASGGPSDSPVGSGAPGSATASTSASGSAASGLRDPVQLSVEVRGPGGRHLASGLGECQHTAEASIYGVPAELWRASFEAGESEDLNAVSLTLWQPKAGGAMQVNLSLRGRAGQRSIATVEGGTISGRGNGVGQAGGRGGDPERERGGCGRNAGRGHGPLRTGDRAGGGGGLISRWLPPRWNRPARCPRFP